MQFVIDVVHCTRNENLWFYILLWCHRKPVKIISSILPHEYFMLRKYNYMYIVHVHIKCLTDQIKYVKFSFYFINALCTSLDFSINQQTCALCSRLSNFQVYKYLLYRYIGTYMWLFLSNAIFAVKCCTVTNFFLKILLRRDRNAVFNSL